MEKLQILLMAYVFTLIANLVMGIVQYRTNRTRIYFNMILIWCSTLVILVFNLLISTLGPVLATLAVGPPVLFNSMLHGYFLSQITETHFPKKPVLVAFGFGYLFAIIGLNVGLPFSVVVPISTVFCSLPFLTSMFTVIKKSKRSLTAPERAFIFTQLGVIALNLTWDPQNQDARSQLMGFAISLALGQFEAIIVPIVANDAIFRNRTNLLEKEIADRVQDLSVAREHLWESNKLASIGRMAGGLAHELNNPLAVIRLQADLIAKQTEKNQTSKERIIAAMAKIRETVIRISDLTLALRKIAKDESASQLVEMEFEPLIRSAVDLCKERLDALGIELKLELSTDKILVKGNPSDLTQVLVNLLANAIDAVEKHPTRWIRVVLKEEDSMTALLIEDSGKIPIENVDQIMEPFFTTKPLGKGVGLGLTLSKSIIENLKGSLSLDKAAEVTRFIIRLPKAQHFSAIAKAG